MKKQQRNARTKIYITLGFSHDLFHNSKVQKVTRVRHVFFRVEFSTLTRCVRTCEYVNFLRVEIAK